MAVGHEGSGHGGIEKKSHMHGVFPDAGFYFKVGEVLRTLLTVAAMARRRSLAMAAYSVLGG